jgi:two-component system, cell cycle response regulator
MEKRSVLIVDDEPEHIQQLERNLEAAGYDIHIANDGYAALTKARVMAPDLIIMDLMIRGLRGVEVKNRLNLEPSTVHIPVIFMTDKISTDAKVMGFNVKAEDVVAKPLNFTELLPRLDSLATRYRDRDQLLVTDPLTGLNNLHVFRRNLSQLFNVAQRYKRPFSLAVADMDGLKPINDNYGHAAGDQALRSFAKCMKQSFRETDILIRYGGDEFVVLFPESDEKDAQLGIDRFRKNVALMSINVGKKNIKLSTSIGLASYNEKFTRPMDLFELADRLMYQEKTAKKATKSALSSSKPKTKPRRKT